MNKYTINFTDCKYIYDIHQAIKTGLDFPDYYGENWDAFWDCITDFPRKKFCIEIVGLDKAQNKFAYDKNKFINILNEYKNEKNPALILILNYNDETYEI